MSDIASYYQTLLNSILNERISRNSAYSLRSFSRDLKISPASLSMILSSKRGISVAKATQIAVLLKLTESQKELFLASAKLSKVSQAKRSQKLTHLHTTLNRFDLADKNEISWRLSDLTHSLFYPAETEEVLSMFQRYTVWKRHRFFSETNMMFRTIQLLKDKKTGLVADQFVEIVYSEDVRFTNVNYFLKNCDGTFKVYANDYLNGLDVVTRVDAENQDVSIQFDSDHLPDIEKIFLKKVGTSQYLVARMKYAAKSALISGSFVDLNPGIIGNCDSVSYQFKKLNL